MTLNRIFSAHLALLVALTATLGFLTSTYGQEQQGQEEDAIFSGPQPGEAMQPFQVRGVYDDAAGKEMELLADVGERPVLLVFVHKVTRPSIGVTRALVDFAAKQKDANVETVLVFLTDDVTDTDNWLKRARDAIPKDATIGIALGGQEGPGAYGLNRNVTLTILVGKGDKVTANFALVQPSLQADALKVARALADAAELKKKPTLNDLVSRNGRNMRAESDPNLRPLLRDLIQKDATEEEVQRAAEKVEAYAKEHPRAAREIQQIAKRIIDAGRLENYGTPAAQKYLTKWAGQKDESNER